MSISLIAAMDKNRVIGKDGKLPWNLPIDIEHFKKLTLNKPVIMGKNTWDSLPEKFKPLPNRLNIVLTHDKNFKDEGCVVVHTIEDALRAASSYEEIMIIGGESVYRQFLPSAQKMYLTFVSCDVGAGDAFFPEFEEEEWNIVKEETFDPDEKNAYGGRFVELERKIQPPKL